MSAKAVRSRRAEPEQPTQATTKEVVRATVKQGSTRKQQGTVISENNPVSKEVSFVAAGRGPKLGHVLLGGSITQNMGDFNSASAWAEVKVPCGESAEEYDAAKAKAAELLDRYLQEEYKAATS